MKLISPHIRNTSCYSDTLESRIKEPGQILRPYLFWSRLVLWYFIPFPYWSSRQTKRILRKLPVLWHAPKTNRRRMNKMPAFKIVGGKESNCLPKEGQSHHDLAQISTDCMDLSHMVDNFDRNQSTVILGSLQTWKKKRNGITYENLSLPLNET